MPSARGAANGGVQPARVVRKVHALSRGNGPIAGAVRRSRARLTHAHRRAQRGAVVRFLVWTRPDDAQSRAGAATTFSRPCSRTPGWLLRHRAMRTYTERSGIVMAVITELLNVEVDGRAVQVRPGANALDAINAAGVYIPQLCKDPDQKARGACRTCLVQVDGMRGFPASCTTPCNEGMRISVESPDAQRIRRGVIELTMGMHPDACETNRPNTHNDVVDAASAHGITSPRFAPLPDPS